MSLNSVKLTILQFGGQYRSWLVAHSSTGRLLLTWKADLWEPVDEHVPGSQHLTSSLPSFVGYELETLLCCLLVAEKFLPCSIQALLSTPNPDDPLSEDIAKHWKDNELEAIATGEDQISGQAYFSCTRRGCHLVIEKLVNNQLARLGSWKFICCLSLYTA